MPRDRLYLWITVIDMNGQPLDEIVVKVINGGETLLTTGLIFETLATCLGLAKLDDVLLMLALLLAVISTGLIWTKITYLSKL